MTKRRLEIRKLAAIVICLVGITVFASCDKPEDDKPTDPNAPAFTEFSVTGQVGDAVIDNAKRTVKATVQCGTNLANLKPEFKLSPEGTTAKVDGAPQISGTTVVDFAEPVIYTLTTSDSKSEQWTVTITDNCGNPPESKKYFTYKEPVTAYYYEKNGGAIDANIGNRIVVHAYENKKMSHVSWWGHANAWVIEHVYGSGEGQYLHGPYNKIGHTEWQYTITEPWDDWLSDDYKPHEFPLEEFGTAVATCFMWISGGHLSGIYDTDPSNMPDKVDVTDWYVRSEKVLDIMCDVFVEDKLKHGYINTYWVDLTTGLTMKYERFDKSENKIEESWEVTKLVIGSPDWDGYHLQPREDDTITGY